MMSPQALLRRARAVAYGGGLTMNQCIDGESRCPAVACAMFDVVPLRDPLRYGTKVDVEAMDRLMRLLIPFDVTDLFPEGL